MENRHGRPIWYELVTDDADGADRFYGHVFGWSFHRPPGGLARDYRIAEANGTAIAGMMQRPADMDMPSRWHVYFGVDDVDRAVREAQEAGAAVQLAPMEIPGVGRLAFLADPQGQPFYLMRSASETPSRAFVCGEPAPHGHAVWNELSAPDPAAALVFYGRLLSIRAEGAMPMGDLGAYQFIHAGPDSIGALMGPVPGGQLGWQIYFAVDDIDAALARLSEAGGHGIQGPDPIPGGAFSLVAEDALGVRFGLVGPRASA
ncbi:VOC family protein [Fulvimarina sp. 2208YS6-2-32]|uniref:VOC family protein n=1 Tax=Fulvimarina uroteuthidis TaxID=3098149 RepID=A0ABU5I073_9HYPH|nr:VOC family protein [Fulvimarina sp. 2208YS6-2-32]MDY8108780.1 VOC family protein [Fulvimarina sp. 2208YS6-2-32]